MPTNEQNAALASVIYAQLVRQIPSQQPLQCLTNSLVKLLQCETRAEPSAWRMPSCAKPGIL
eukprot:6419283-Amphidinium_carterae.1